MKKYPFHVRKASYTLEAAVILPVVTGLFVTVLMFFRILQIQTCVQESLTYASRKTAVESCLTDDVISFATAEALFRNHMKDSMIEKYVVGGRNGIHLLSSDLTGDFVTLNASYQVKMPVGFFSISQIELSQCSKSRKWTGMKVEETTSEEIVYVTEYGTVYHKKKTCSHLDLSIRPVDLAEISLLRNKNGHKYRECGCKAENSTNNIVYVTDYGECYHRALSCSGLKRTIYEIRLSEVGDRRPCSKCGGE